VVPDIRIKLGDLVRDFGGELLGDAEILISGLGTLAGAGPDDISFLSNSKYRSQLTGTRAAAVILAPQDRDATQLPRIVTKNPYAYMAKVSALLHPVARPAPGIHPSAVVDATARIAADAAIGPHAVIAEQAVIGPGAVIGAGCCIGAAVEIGAATRLYPGVSVYAHCKLGQRTIVHSGTVIGADGFGLAPEAGRWLKVPQVGRVVIGDDVEIGANTTIDRGALEDTVIEDGVKLDNQIQIAHNVRIGAHTAIAACVGIAGSTVIGQHCVIGGAAMFVGHIHVADGVTISGGTLVSKSIDAPGTYTAMWAAAPHREWLKTVAQLRRLDSLTQRIRELEQKIQAIERNAP
jgi:UDP-3-O-[3-hydroxymyristoyl] glucosamine N-acyltransferase